MKIINLTPHSVQVGENSFPPSGQLARCNETWQSENEIDGIAFLSGFKYGETNLPAPDSETHYIVALPVALAEPNRTDLLISVGQIRDGDGKIIGAKGLARLNEPETNQAQKFAADWGCNFDEGTIPEPREKMEENMEKAFAQAEVGLHHQVTNGPLLPEGATMTKFDWEGNSASFQIIFADGSVLDCTFSD